MNSKNVCPSGVNLKLTKYISNQIQSKARNLHFTALNQTC